MKTNKRTIIIRTLMTLALLSLSATAFAAPSISAASGTYTDGSTVAISGASFGANAASGTSAQESLASAISAGSNGSQFSRANWSVDTQWTGNITYTTSNTRGGSRTKALIAACSYSWPETPLYYKFPSAVTNGDHIFISWWEQVTWSGNGQYKMLRLSPTQTIVDGTGQDVFFFHNNSGGTVFGLDMVNSTYPPFSPATPQSTWARIDVDMTMSTTSGTLNMAKYIPGQAVQTWTTSFANFVSGYNQNYLVWQNYFGTDGGGSMTAGTVWLDSIYIQHGTSARVELCDASTWAARKNCEIQPTTYWDGTSGKINIQLSTGTLSGSAYLYVIDASGNVSAGKLITLGSSGGSSGSTQPNPPAALK